MEQVGGCKTIQCTKALLFLRFVLGTRVPASNRCDSRRPGYLTTTLKTPGLPATGARVTAAAFSLIAGLTPSAATAA